MCNLACGTRCINILDQSFPMNICHWVYMCPGREAEEEVNKCGEVDRIEPERSLSYREIKKVSVTRVSGTEV